jgi:hypothetical protein
MVRARYYFSQILNVHGLSEVRQAEIHSRTASALEVELAIEKLKATNHQILIKYLQN